MRDWFLKNLTWIFSGIGIFVLAGAYKLIKWLLRNKEKLPSFTVSAGGMSVKISGDDFRGQRPSFGTPDPFEIIGAIQAVPILQQDDVAKHYARIPVDWIAKVADIERTGAGFIKFQAFMKGQGKRACFFFEVNSADYPGIGLLRAGEKIHVQGLIKNATKDFIRLQDAKLIQYGERTFSQNKRSDLQ